MRMRTRKTIIWASIIFVGGPIAIFLLNDLPTLLYNMELLASGVLIISLAVAGWRLKRRLKRQMAQGLGRMVEDGELTSIAAWMRIPDQAARAEKEAEKYDFDD